jgi:hypothetical protein
MKSKILVLVAILFFSSQVFAQDVFNNCPMEGDAKRPQVRSLNLLKNRYVAPKPEDFDPAVTLKTLLVPGDDARRWDNHKAGEVTGYVYDVKVGGIETCNCHAKDTQNRDTHIELVLDPEQTTETKRVIVEVTPRWRKMMADSGLDWTTAGLRKNLKGWWVKFKGWIMFDEEHKYQSENTYPDGDRNWRATAWEIHPITSIEVVQAPEP